MSPINEFFAIAPAALAVITPFIIMALAIVFFFKNPILLRSLLWERVMGRRLDVHDPILDQAIKDQMDLNQARSFLPGYRLRNIYHARAIIEWCRENELGHDELRGMDGFVSYADGQVRVAEESYNPQQILCAVIFFLAAIAFIPAASFAAITSLTHSVLAKGNESGTYFLIDAEKIIPASPLVRRSEGWVLDRESCKHGQTVGDSLTKAEREAICASIEADEMKRYVDENFSQNFYGLIVLAILFLSVALAGFYQNSRYIRFKELRRRRLMAIRRREFELCLTDVDSVQD